jgi:ubiquinone/menaquinone biosynthesis C-methylase UbiE
MIFSTFFSRQAKKPSGLFGRFFMSRVFEKGNAELNSLVLQSLSIKEGEHVLEIGFGTGLFLNRIAASIDNGLIEGIDFSELMVDMAKKKNKRYIEAGKAKIHSGDFDKAVFNDNSFDKIFTVNTIYFWKRPDATVFKIYRLLKPGGRLFIGFHGKSDMEKMPLNRDIFQYYSTHGITELLSIRGPLNNIQIISKKGKRTTCYCAVATKRIDG